MKIIKYLTQTIIPRGRSKQIINLKISTSTNLQNNRRPQFHKEKLDQQILMDKSPHQLAKTKSTSSEELSSLLTVYYMKIHQNSTFNKSNGYGCFSIHHQQNLATLT
jgi:hypothetical protein